MAARALRDWMLGSGLALAASTPLQAQEAPLPKGPTAAQVEADADPAQKRPVTLSGSYASDLNADVAGGERRGAAYLGRLSLLADADLDGLVGLRSAMLHLSILQIHGTGASGHFVGNTAAVSGIEAEPALRLNQIWVQFPLAKGAQLRLGKITAQEFFASPTAGLFINSSFGWPASFATDLPSGGPSWPLGAPGARLSVSASSKTTARIAIFAGDPAGPGQGDPQRRDGHGFNAFGFAGQPFVIGELSTTLPGGGVATLGGWKHFGRFDDVGGRADRHVGNFAVYGVVDVPLWKSARVPGQGVSGFARITVGPSDRNPVDLYLDGGVSLSGPFRNRPGDVLGIAVAFARLSPRLAGNGAADPLPSGEWVMEASYRLAVGKRMSLQPNLQYVVHPAASALVSPPGPRTPDALVLGLRTSATF
ncbi:carbohydrate porin [Sphingomonas sp. JC676]|uniref:carbohydrate porin n=1 Tax=Sphingomonas sp. JC676 TaxID=2768065 RepID=UPI0016580811|nr:carbohydrate porin [Sphingomonas sp. JC676]MBC9032633.1 carbohydrate porin [Sphingomonas sp. JC676]